MPSKAEIPQQLRQSKHPLAVAVFHEAGSIIRWGGPAIKRKIPSERWLPSAREEKEKRGREALGVFHKQLLSAAEDVDHERYQTIFGTQSDQARQGHSDEPYWNISFLGKGWNTFAAKFTTAKGEWVIKVGYLNSPNPMFFANPSHPIHSAEMRQNIQNIKIAADAAGIQDFVAFPQEVMHLPLPQYSAEDGDHAVTVHVMPYIKSVPRRELRRLLKDPHTRQHLIEEKRAIDNVRKTLQHDANSDFDLTGDGNVAIVWKKDSQGVVYPGFQIIDMGLRIYGLNTPITDTFFDLTGLWRGYRLRRQVPSSDDRPGRMEDFLAEFKLTQNGRHMRGEIRRRLSSERFNQSVERFFGTRRGRDDKAA